MADFKVKNYYLITLLDSNENFVIPNSWIYARVGGAVVVFLPHQDHEKLAMMGGPYCVSWHWKYAQIERGFDHYSEAFYYLNKSKVHKTGQATKHELCNQIFENDMNAQTNATKNMSELEALLRSNSHLQLKNTNKNKSTAQNSLENTTSNLKLLLKETYTHKPEASLRLCQKPHAHASPKESLSKEPPNIEIQLGDHKPNVATFKYGQIVESTVSTKLRLGATCSQEQQKKKNVPGLLPIKPMKLSETHIVVNPVQIARVAPLVTPSVIVFNKAAITKTGSLLKNKGADQEENRQEIQYNNQLSLKSKKFSQHETNSLSKASNNPPVFLDLTKSPEVEKEYLSKVNPNLEANKINVNMTSAQSNNASPKQYCVSFVKSNDVEQQSENNLFPPRNKNKDQSNISPETSTGSKLEISETQPSTSADTFYVTPICTLPHMQNQDKFSSNKINLLKYILQNLEKGLTVYENLKTTRTNMTESVKAVIKTTKNTRQLIDESLRKAKKSSQRRVIKKGAKQHTSFTTKKKHKILKK